MEMDKMEEVSLLDSQIITFPTDVFNTNRLVFTTDGTAVLGTDALGVMGEMGLSLVSIPIQIVQDTPIQQHVMTSEVLPETTTIYLDQSQLAYVNGSQLVITDEGFLTSVPAEQLTIDKDSLLFAPATDSVTDGIKPIGSLNTLDLSCLATTEDLLLGDSADLGPELPPSPSGEELVITGPEVTWKGTEEGEVTSKKDNGPVKDCNKDIPPPLRKGPFKCEICFKEFPQYSQYRKHSQLHLEEKPHKCPACPASFNIPNNLILHKATHQLDNLECPECFKKFSRVASLKAHIMLHEREESLFCTECGDEFGNQVQLDKHMQSHDEEWVNPKARVYRCPSCDKQYSRASVLRQHMKDHYKVKAALSANSYNRAVRRGRLLHSCTVCSKTFQKPSQLIRHNRIHTGEKPFKCEMCSRSFNQKGSLLIHMMSTHKGMRPYQCQFCSAAFSQKGNLRAHVVRLHSIPNTQETVYQCKECSCVFRKLGSLNAHQNRMHPPFTSSQDVKKPVDVNLVKVKAQIPAGLKDTSDKENDAQEEKDLPQQRIITISNKLEDGSVKQTTMKQRQIGTIKWHQCTFCGKEFKKPSDLVRHTRIHTQEKPYKCKYCCRGFTVRSTLVTHMRTHTGNKEHKCTICNKSFSSASVLWKHKKVQHMNKTVVVKETAEESQPQEQQQEPGNTVQVEHNGSSSNVMSADYQQPLVLTDQGVMQVVTLRQVWSVADNPDRPHRCHICGHSYRKSNHLKVHLRNHSGERPFACNLCPRTFTSAGVLKGHMRTHTMLKTHRCNECGKYLSTKGSLQRHAVTHTGLSQPYSCPYCPRAYKSHSACRKHIQTHDLVVSSSALETVEEEGQGDLDMEVAEVQETDDGEEEVAADTDAVEASLTVSMPNIEALIVNRANLGLANTVLTAEEPFVVSRVEGVGETTLPVSQTLHADATGTITLPALSGQDALTQESIREIEESLNQQLFCTADLSLDKEQVVLFDQGFESCVFPSITQIELGQALTSASLASILPTPTHTVFSCEECGAQYKSDSEMNAHRLSHLQKQCLVEARTITLGDTTIQLEEDLAAANLPSIDTDHDMEYRCDVCNHLCESGEDLAKHRESHSSCEICEKTFATAAQYKAHVKSHGREKEYVCEHCGSSFTQLSSLARHLAIHNSDDKIYTCSVCSQSFRSEGLLRRHANEHREGKAAARRRRGEVRQLTEEEAQRLATQEGNSMSERVLIASIAERDRISDVKDPEMFKNEPVHANCCKYCPKSFRKPSDLVRHLRIHTGERPYQCDFCAKCFTVKSTLDSHLKTHNSQKRCVCHVCGFFFATKGSLKVHMRLHTGSRPFRCPVCLQRFRTSGHRKSHLLLHIKEAQPQLLREVAGTSTTQPDTTATTIAAPLANLGVVAQYSCNVCEKTFNKQSTLVRHTRVHTGEKPFQCKVCDKCFTQKNSLDTHMKIHTGERQFSCTECEGTTRPQRFTQKCNLDTHIRRHHPPTPTPTPFTIDLSEEKFPVDLEKVVSDLFPHMKSKAALTHDEL